MGLIDLVERRLDGLRRIDILELHLVNAQSQFVLIHDGLQLRERFSFNFLSADRNDFIHRAIAYDRSHCPESGPRQLGAMAASGDRSEALRSLTTPMLVIHGLDDTLITPAGGRRTAELVPGAHLLEVSDMGHDMPAPLWPLLAAAIVAHGRTVEHSSPEVFL